MFLFCEIVLRNRKKFCEKNMFDICHSVLPVICWHFATSLKNHKIFVDRSISLKFERMVANGWRKNRKFPFKPPQLGLGVNGLRWRPSQIFACVPLFPKLLSNLFAAFWSLKLFLFPKIFWHCSPFSPFKLVMFPCYPKPLGGPKMLYGNRYRCLWPPRRRTIVYDYLTIRPVALAGYGSIAHEAKPNGLLIITHWNNFCKHFLCVMKLLHTSR